jgi:hypothetical protein
MVGRDRWARDDIERIRPYHLTFESRETGSDGEKFS